jgi:hypothetical protein
LAGTLDSVAGSYLLAMRLTSRRPEGTSKKLCGCFIAFGCRILDFEPTYPSPETLGVQTEGGSNEGLGGTPVEMTHAERLILIMLSEI